MKASLPLLFIAAVLASCSSSYTIKGTSDVAMLDGHKLYLKAVKGNEVKNVDSCDIVHGKFEFCGQIDSIPQVGAIYMDSESLMPVVIEEGDIEISINSAIQTCKGTPLNDKLSVFTEKFNQLSNQLSDLDHQHSQAIMNGEDIDAVTVRLNAQAQKLADDEETLITTFIEENFDNILAPFAFQMATSSMQYPMLTPWIEALMVKASETFKNDKYVKEFIETAEHNRDIMTGLENPTPQPVAPPVNQPIDQAPTPNQMAGEE